MKMSEAMGVKRDEILTRDAQAYTCRSYVSTVDHDRHELDLLTGVLMDTVIKRILIQKEAKYNLAKLQW